MLEAYLDNNFFNRLINSVYLEAPYKLWWPN